MFTQKFVVMGNLTSEILGEDKLFMKPEVSHVFELSAALAIQDVEGIGEVEGKTATTRIVLDYGNYIYFFNKYLHNLFEQKRCHFKLCSGLSTIAFIGG